MKCGMKADRFVCKQPCNQQLTSCGHICPCSCGEECDKTKCMVERTKICAHCYTGYIVKCNQYESITKCPKHDCPSNFNDKDSRRVYDRNYLLSLRSECIDKPNGIGPNTLSNVDAVLDVPRWTIPNLDRPDTYKIVEPSKLTKLWNKNVKKRC